MYDREGGVLLSQPKEKFVSPWQESVESAGHKTESYS